MQIYESGPGPSGYLPEGSEEPLQADRADEAIFTCKFPGCSRQYASTDGVRKHCRKSHPEWLREVDLDKANHNCRWAAYCTREAITEGNDPRTTPAGSKRAREIMAQGGALPPITGSSYGAALQATGLHAATSHDSSSSRPQSFDYLVNDEGRGVVPSAHHQPHRVEQPPPKAPRQAPPSHLVAMDGKSALVPHRPFPSTSDRSSSRSENLMPPEMIALPGELLSPLPSNVSSLTPNAQARQRLGEIADSESACLQGGTAMQAHLPPSPHAPEEARWGSGPLQPSHLVGANSFFVQWGMPPLKRGLSLADTREAAAQKAMENGGITTPHGYEADDASVTTQDSPSFLDSVLA